MLSPVTDKGWPNFIAEFMAQHFLPLYNSIKEGQPCPRTDEEINTAIRDTGLLLYYGMITPAKAKKCFKLWWDTGISIEDQNTRESIMKLVNPWIYVYICFTVVFKNKATVQECVKGITKRQGSLLGQAISMSNDKADPELIKQLIAQIISYGDDINWTGIGDFLEKANGTVKDNFY